MSPGAERSASGAGGWASAGALEEERVFSLDAYAARAAADLLELLAELPSTPTGLAEVSRVVAGEITRLLPVGGGVAHAPGTVDLEATNLVAAAGLLDRFGALASTPPMVAGDARDRAADLWARLEDDGTDPARTP